MKTSPLFVTTLLLLMGAGSWVRPVQGTLDLLECNAITMICGDLVNDALHLYPNYANLTTPQLIQRLGYPVETHVVQTDDGYLLTMYRIPSSTSSPGTSGKIPVLLVHGVLASSVQWLWQPPSRALAFMLVDQGYDVWLGNSRGTSYSRGHVSLPSNSSSDLRYWDFSFHEMGKYDLPATVNYITALTSQPSLYYIGHSLGTTQFFSGITLHPELAPKIRTMFSLATSGYINHSTNPFFRAVSLILASYTTEQLINGLGGGQFSPQIIQQYIGNFTQYCTQYTLNCGVCNTVFGVLFGIDMCQTDFSQLPGILSHLPDTTSTKTFSHITQDMSLGTFSQYNYGLLNPSKYSGALHPPAYDWTKYNVPTVIYYGDNDNLAVLVDVQATRVALGANVKEMKRIDYLTFSHMDFVVGVDADILLYNDMINIIRNQTYG